MPPGLRRYPPALWLPSLRRDKQDADLRVRDELRQVDRRPAKSSLPPATLKIDYGTFKTLDKKMVPLAPDSVRPDLQSVFNFDLALFSEL